jgi:hypothetical protein
VSDPSHPPFFRVSLFRVSSLDRADHHESHRPHYRLEAATEALVAGLEERGQSHLYKQIDTLDFTQEIVKQFDENWFFINEDQVVRK